MTQEYWFEKDPRIKAIYDQAGEEEKELMRVTEQIIRSKSKQWQDKFARLPALEAVKMLRKEFEKAAKAEQYLKSDTEWNRMLAGLSPEERLKVHKAAAAEQKRILFNEPWLLRKFDYEDRMSILAGYTPEQQKIMKARMDLEDDFRREKRKGFG
tara:strand:+ start:979 stop:1443 length:465 start_codon:yes stop_codon:yes gene_type:complete